MRIPTLFKSDPGRDSGGFTLVEVMVSIIILMVGMLGMFQAINLAMDKNLEGQLMQRGVEVAEQQMSDLKARPFLNITGVSKKRVQVAVGAAFKSMSVQSQVLDLAVSESKTKQVSVRVWWRYRGRTYEHQTASGIGINNLSAGN